MTKQMPRLHQRAHHAMIVEEKKTSEEPPSYCHDSDIPFMRKVDYSALADRCLMLLKEHPDRKVFVGVAGTPGSGKSSVAEQVKDAINQDPSHNNEELCEIINMDGYHLSRAQLKAKAERGGKFKVDEDLRVEYKQMTFDELIQRRGASFTFWPEKFIQDLRSVRDKGEGSLPVYGREEHDPVQDGTKIHQHNKIILVEGLYVLSFDNPDWQPVQDIWDDKWYVDVSMKETKRRLVKRHLENWTEEKTRFWGGSDEAAAACKAEANDMKNARVIQRSARHNANLIISNEGLIIRD